MLKIKYSEIFVEIERIIESISRLYNITHTSYKYVSDEEAKKKKAKMEKQIDEIALIENVQRQDLTPIEEECDCYACKHYTKSYIINVYRESLSISYTLVFRTIAIVLGIVLFVILVWLTLARRSMRPKKSKTIQVVTKQTKNNAGTTSVFDSNPNKVVVNTNKDNNNNNNS